MLPTRVVFRAERKSGDGYEDGAGRPHLPLLKCVTAMHLQSKVVVWMVSLLFNKAYKSGLYLFIYFCYCICVSMHGWASDISRLWRSENNFQDLVLSCHHVSSWGDT